MESNNTEKPDNLHEFHKLLKDFMRDLLNTFPEYKEKIGEEMLYLYQIDVNETDDDGKYNNVLSKVHEYCARVFPERFFDILYKNETIFSPENEANTMFYPNVDFKDLWSEDIIDKTKEVLWKYLQLTLFTVVNSINNVSNFGDTAKLLRQLMKMNYKRKLLKHLKVFHQCLIWIAVV